MPWPPADFGFLDKITHKIELTSNGQTIEFEVKGGGAISRRVSLGQWHVKIDAWLIDVQTPASPNLGNVHYATGSNSLTVTAGQNRVDVQMNPICQNCGGTQCDCYTGIFPIYGYRVYFDSNGGTSVDTITNIPHGSKIIRPDDPVQDDYYFYAWYKETDFITKWDFYTDTVTQNITLYAKWYPYNCNDSPQHSWGNYTQTTPPTCTTEGIRTRQCTACQAPYPVELPGDPVTPHVWEWTLEAIQRTCKEYSKDTATCSNSNCQATNIRDGFFDPVGCNFSVWTTTKAPSFHNNDSTICEEGIEELRCSRFAQCGEWEVRRDIPCLGTQGLAWNGTTNQVGINRALNAIHVCIPERAIHIDSGAFGNATSNMANQTIESIHIGANVNAIGNDAFRNCHELNSVAFADDSRLTSIGDNAFSRCIKLTLIVLPDSLTTIGTNAFAYCTSLASITIPDSVTTIQNSAFQYSGLTSIILPNNPHFTTIGAGAFRDTALTSINISNSVTTIHNNAFTNCTDLTSVIIGNNVTNIGGEAFMGCIGLERVTFERTTPPTTLGQFVFTNTHSTLRIYVPAGSADDYRAVANLNTWRNRIHRVGCEEDNPATGSVCSCP